MKKNNPALLPPKVTVIGFTLELYSQKFPGYMERLSEQLEKFCAAIKGQTEIEFESAVLCYTADQVEAQINRAGQAESDAILLIPLSYACSGVIVPGLKRAADIPLIIWNTQEMESIDPDYNHDDLLMNHVTQGTQDITSVLLRERRIFGMESGHYQDHNTLLKLAEWLDAARALRFARRLRVGIMGNPFAGMDDFLFDPKAMADILGFHTVRIAPTRLVAARQSISAKAVDEEVRRDREKFDIDQAVTSETHRLSTELALALRKIRDDEKLDAFTMNFLDLIDTPDIGTLPFTGINKLIGEGMGYAGEGDILRAAQMAVMRQLAGAANFTEIFTIDYRRNRLLMTHMQECNPALARHDRKIRLVKKDFWAPGILPYVGMWFTLEPGPTTLSALVAGADNTFHYVTHEAEIADEPPLKGLDTPHWLAQLNIPAGRFLTGYSMAGGPHHLIAMPGHQNSRLEKLARLQGIKHGSILRANQD